VTHLPQHLGPYLDASSFEAQWHSLADDAGARASIAGRSVEGRPLWRFDFGREDGAPVLLTGLIHGVEYIGSVALFDFVRSLVAQGDRGVLGDARVVVMPIVNPDALRANTSRLSRGSRAYRRGNANGVDLNRNFPRLSPRTPLHPFAGSRFRFSPHYTGPHAFSEPESRALRDVALEIRPRVAIGFHSFGDMLLFPWAHTARKNPRHARYESIGGAFRRAQRAPYAVMQAIGLYATVGDLDDWLDAEFGTLAFTVEVSRPSRRLASPRRLLNPFCWMNPTEIDGTVANLTPGLHALGAAALDAAA
jgi:predicted deacylase